jgi:hypothetical protein
MALAQLEFIYRAEVLHFLGPPGTGKSHLATALGVAAVKAGRSVYRCTLSCHGWNLSIVYHGSPFLFPDGRHPEHPPDRSTSGKIGADWCSTARPTCLQKVQA